MRARDGLTVGNVVAIILVAAVVVLLAWVILIPTLGTSNELTTRTTCMTNLSAIGKALTLYRAQNSNAWPWISDRLDKWDTNPVGLNAERDPFADANDPGGRSITSLMFLLVREGQPVQLFVCPSTSDFKDEYTVDTNVPEGEEPEYFWDFTSYHNVSYSWQAPVLNDSGAYVNGMSDNDNDTAICADKTPLSANPQWRPDNVAGLTGGAIERNMSPNHQGKPVNALYVGMNVVPGKRPDIGYRHDNIFTASGDAKGGSRSATSVRIIDHKSTRDSFLIGPVAGGAGDANE